MARPSAADRIADLTLELEQARTRAEAEAFDARELRDILRRNGFRPCDLLACNCDGWHQVDGYAARFREIDEAIGDHDGKTLLQAVNSKLEELAMARRVIATMEDIDLVREAGRASLEATIEAHRTTIRAHEGKIASLQRMNVDLTQIVDGIGRGAQ